MKILILGSDGYIGYSLTLHLLKKGHNVTGLDNFSRRRRVNDLGSESLTPITSPIGRKSYLKFNYKNFNELIHLNLGRSPASFTEHVLRNVQPDCIVHLAEQPSAPWSMKDVEYATDTQYENVIGTLHLLWAMKNVCPNAHLVKLGTMGEYGTPDCDIPEGRIPARPCKLNQREGRDLCPMHGLLFPRTPGSFYHASKVMDTINIEFSCRNWGLRSTDIMQGIVFGLNADENTPLEELTRFDYDECFGTAINRFCAQSLIGHPLTVYGKGEQIRGFLPLKDSIQCLTIAIENPPLEGEYRTLNQLENIYSINSLADMVCRGSKELGLNYSISHLKNPRNEAEQHYYNPIHQKLLDLGYEPTTDIQQEITTLINTLIPFKDRVRPHVINPLIKWR